MKRLVMFSPGHGEAGGAASRSRLIALELAGSGWQVLAITRAGTFNRFRVIRGPGLRVLEIPGFKQPALGGALYLALAIPIGLIAGIRAKNFLAIQLMSTTTAAGVCSLLLRRGFVTMSTTSGRLGESRYISGTRTSWLRRRLLRRATWIVAQTDAVAEELRELTESDRVIVLPNPVALREATPLTGQPRVLFTGRFAAEKDLLGLLDAWESVLSEEPDAKLTLAGSGGEYRSVEADVRERIAGSESLRNGVELSGWIDDVPAILSANDVFVLPSLEEGMSNALLEAVASGRIIVASDIAPNRAVVGDDYPLLYPAGDSSALASALLKGVRLPAGEQEAIRSILAERLTAFAPAAVIARLEELMDAADRPRH